MDITEAKKLFNQLSVANYLDDTRLQLLLELRKQSGLTPDDQGWLLWNLCDWYALTSNYNPEVQHTYQSEFRDFVNETFVERAHWVVSDGTQALSLIKGGYSDFWCECYDAANRSAPKCAENRAVRFESHRANAAAFTFFGWKERTQAALQALSDLVAEDHDWDNSEYASVTYSTLKLQFMADGEPAAAPVEVAAELESQLERWSSSLRDTASPDLADKPPFGSWQHLSEFRPEADGYSVCLNNAACALAKAGQFEAAERLFRKWLKFRRRPLQDYGEAMFLWSCWRNGTSEEQILQMLNESGRIGAKWLAQVVPEMAWVVRES